MKVIASVQARLGSSRLPGKVLFNLGDRRLLSWSVKRANSAKTIDQTIVTVGDRPENDAVREYCKRANIDYTTGPEDDLLARHNSIVRQSGCDLLVRITADCPFVPSEQIDTVVKRHLSNDALYTTNVTENMPIGIGVDAIDPELLTTFDSLGETHPTKRARENPEKWGTAWFQDPSWEDVAEAHLAVDTPSDYWSLVDALEAVGDKPHAIADWLLQ